MEHPFTAHIAPHSPPPLPPSESCLREGEDYNSSDYEYDSDAEEDYDQLPPGGVNETLTKKKFCQSAKVFWWLWGAHTQTRQSTPSFLWATPPYSKSASGFSVN